MAKAKQNKPIIICDTTIQPGERATLDLPIAPLYTRTPMDIPIHVIHGKTPGPTLLVCAAVHGDELNGVEIIRRLLKSRFLKQLSGTLVAIPIVNMFGFIYHSRYLPDRRDLNRSFPGSKTGSMAARITHVLIKEIISKCTHGIDLHTGAIHRTNLPQIRANLNDKTTLRMAKAFGVPVLLNSSEIDGSLRTTATRLGLPFLLYEAGEALRIDELSVRAGFKGVLNVMRTLKMLPQSSKSGIIRKPFIAHSNQWVRASQSGLFISSAKLGKRVIKGETIAYIADPISGTKTPVKSPAKGIIIGRNHLPLVNGGEALFNLAKFEESKKVFKEVEEFHTEHLDTDNFPGTLAD